MYVVKKKQKENKKQKGNKKETKTKKNIKKNLKKLYTTVWFCI